MQTTKNNNLIIFDWDDTLFPTSWMVKNNIDLTKKSTQQQYINLFSKLDAVLFELLNNINKNSQIIIITNAMAKWVEISMVMLPKSQPIITNNIPIISARESYKNKFPNDMTQWKLYTFKDVIKSHYEKYPNCNNIISVGDANYELLATVDLYDTDAHKNKKYLKTVKLFDEPSFESLVIQLKLLNNNIPKIITNKKHLDLKFTNKKKN